LNFKHQHILQPCSNQNNRTERAKIIASLFVTQERVRKRLRRQIIAQQHHSPSAAQLWERKLPSALIWNGSKSNITADYVHWKIHAGFEIENDRVTLKCLKKGSCTEEQRSEPQLSLLKVKCT